MRDLEEQRQARKDKMLKGFGGSNGGKNIRIKVGDGQGNQLGDEPILITNKLE